MLTQEECIDRHRQKEHLNCQLCSAGYQFTLLTREDMPATVERITRLLSEQREWYPYLQKTISLVRFALYEAVVNAIEHGILGLGREKKAAMREELQDRFEDRILTDWEGAKTPVEVSFCLNHRRALLGVHDPGHGFDKGSLPSEKEMAESLMAESGRGLSTLRSFGFSLHWNEEGNSILCSFSRPDVQDAVQA